MRLLSYFALLVNSSGVGSFILIFPPVSQAQPGVSDKSECPICTEYSYGVKIPCFIDAFIELFCTIGQLLRSWFLYSHHPPVSQSQPGVSDKSECPICTEYSYGVKIPGFIDAFNFYGEK